MKIANIYKVMFVVVVATVGVFPLVVYAEEVPASVFLDSLVFKQDSNTDAPGYVLDLTLKEFPLHYQFPHRASGALVGHNWHSIVLYYNTDAPNVKYIPFTVYSNNFEYANWGMTAPNGVKFDYTSCFNGRVFTSSALILPTSAADCNGLGANHASVPYEFSLIDDTNFVLPLNSSMFPSGSPQPGDFVTAALYAYEPGFEPNNYMMRLVSAEPIRYYFQAPQPPIEPKKTPVLIIPGIAGSELKVGEDVIWADLAEMFAQVNDNQITTYLGLDESGQPLDANTKVGGVIEEILGNLPIVNINIFEALKFRLVEAGYSTSQDLFFFPYDWRSDLTETATLLADRIDYIKSQTDSDRVSIVAHSMGGLLTKEYIRQKGEGSIEKLIFVGTPHLGAPKAGKIILEGDRLDIPWLEADRIREVGAHSIAVHELLPGFAYFDRVGPYLRQAIPNVSGNLLDYAETKDLLIDNGSAPAVFAAAESFLARGLEDMSFPGINIYNIAGCDTATQGGYDVRGDGTIAFTQYRAGDKTVPLVSADGVSVPEGHRFYTTSGTHAGLPSTQGVRDLIADILTDEPITTYDSITSDISTCGIRGQELIWRSPVEIHVYDSYGNHTGPIDNNGIEYNIRGVDYEIFGHEKFIFIPAGDGEVYRVIAKGLDTGTFDLSVRQNNNGTVTGATVFNDISVTPSTSAKFDVSNNEPPLAIEVDEEGDGNFTTIQATSMLDDTEAHDIIPPTISIISPASLSYERPRLLAIDAIATDDNSGIYSVDYSLDHGVISSSSVDLFFYALGTHSFEVTATDRAGNTATASHEFRIVAIPDSVISDIEKAYALGWIKKKNVKTGLVSKVKAIIRLERRIEWLEEKLPSGRRILKRVERLEKRIDRVLGTLFLKELEKEYNKGNITQAAYILLKEDIEWLVEQ